MNLQLFLTKGLTGCLVILMLVFSATSVADEQQKIMEQIADNTERLVAKLEQERQTYYSDPAKFYGTMEQALTDVVDFRRIAARVMGRYRRDASDTQKTRFIKTFKRSLFDAYGKTLVESGDIGITVQNAEINPSRPDKARVDLEIVTSSGSRYPVIYNMYKNDKQQKWLLENVIVNGVNIGLAFRDRFQQQYEQNNGNLDKVIAQWSAQLPQ